MYGKSSISPRNKERKPRFFANLGVSYPLPFLPPLYLSFLEISLSFLPIYQLKALPMLATCSVGVFEPIPTTMFHFYDY